MSFQHFSTIFLSTTAGWWGWRGCWWGWKASFIRPMRPAPLLGFPAINLLDDRGGGLAPGPEWTTVGALLDTLSNKNPAVLTPWLTTIRHAEAVQAQGEQKRLCVKLYAMLLLANKLLHSTRYYFNSRARIELATYSLCCCICCQKRHMWPVSSWRRRVKSLWDMSRVLISHTERWTNRLSCSFDQQRARS